MHKTLLSVGLPPGMDVAVATSYAAAGYRVVMAGPNKVQLAELVDRVDMAVVGADILVSAIDVGNWRTVRDLVRPFRSEITVLHYHWNAVPEAPLDTVSYDEGEPHALMGPRAWGAFQAAVQAAQTLALRPMHGVMLLTAGTGPSLQLDSASAAASIWLAATRSAIADILSFEIPLYTLDVSNEMNRSVDAEQLWADAIFALTDDRTARQWA